MPKSRIKQDGQLARDAEIPTLGQIFEGIQSYVGPFLELERSEESHIAMRQTEDNAIAAIREQKEKLRRACALQFQLGKDYYGLDYVEIDLPNGLQTPMKKPDRRSDPNPVKDLKISVRRSFEWSKMSGKTAEEAKLAALGAAERGRLKKSLPTIPNEVFLYIDDLSKHFDDMGEIDEIDWIPEDPGGILGEPEIEIAAG